MKSIWKTIILCATSALLTLSVFFNIFFLTVFEIHDADSFKQALLSKEILDGFSNIGGSEEKPEANNPTIDNPTAETPIPDVNEPEPEVPSVDESFGLQEGQVVYNNNGITITYLNQEEGLLGPKFKFYIVNNSDYTLWVSCTDVYIDGVQADLSGGGVSDIESGKKAYLEFTIWESDYENFTTNPSEVEFDLVVRDDSNWGELDRVEDLILQVK